MTDTTVAGPKLGLFGPMKTPKSAEYALEELPKGRVRAWIRHATIQGVTPEMARWWFEHVDSTTQYNGSDFTGPAVPVYRMWHPYDHISAKWARRVRDASGRLAAGSVISIAEDIGGRYPVRAKAHVTKFDDTAFNFEVRVGGILRGGVLLHEYADARGGCSFYTEMTIGVTLPVIGRFVNAFIRRVMFSDDFLRTWIVHNIEESGETEKFVPQLFAQAKANGVGPT